MTDAYDKVYREREGYMEHADCTVIATSIALGLPYDVAHGLLERQGRRDRHAFHLAHWLKSCAGLGVTLCGYRVTAVNCASLANRQGLNPQRMYYRSSNYRYPTLAKVQRDFPKGRFILRKAHHVFALIDGEWHDTCGPRTRISDLFLFERA